MAFSRDLEIPQTITDLRGRLTVIEFDDLPWVPKRAYFLTHTSPSAERGSHAHKDLHQFFFALVGVWTMKLFNGQDWLEISVAEGDQGVLLEPGYWREIIPETDLAVLAVFASAPYQEEDYIRSIDEFKRWVNHGN
jgi:hypothetical protein